MHIEDLSSERQRTLLARLLPDKADKSKSFPLSFAQERLWFLDQFEPGKSIYNEPVAYLVKGQLNVRALEQSLGEVIRRHEICGIISSDASLRRWAKGKGAPHIEPTDDLIAFVAQRPFDYLFSIVNQRTLPKQILALTTKYAINFHEALLPRYAGTRILVPALSCIGRLPMVSYGT